MLRATILHQTRQFYTTASDDAGSINNCCHKKSAIYFSFRPSEKKCQPNFFFCLKWVKNVNSQP